MLSGCKILRPAVLKTLHAPCLSVGNPGLRQLRRRCRAFASEPCDEAKAVYPSVPRARVTVAEAKKLPRSLREYPNNVILSMCVHGDIHAVRERLTREIMAVHKVSWEDAQPYLDEVRKESRRNFPISKFPFRFAIGVSTFSAFASFPLCFHYPSVFSFNKYFVTADVPEPSDLDTWLEVGNWAWNWMEPPMGQIGFALLCAQYARSQMENIGLKPYTHWWMHKRAQSLELKFPEYSSHALGEFAETDWLAQD